MSLVERPKEDFEIEFGESAKLHLKRYIKGLTPTEVVAMLSWIAELALEKFQGIEKPITLKQKHIEWLEYHTSLDLTRNGIRKLLEDKDI